MSMEHALLGVVAGAIAGWLAARQRAARALRAEVARSTGLDAVLAERSARVERLEAQLARSGEDLVAARAEQARLAADLHHARTANEEKIALLGRAEASLREAFQSLSAEALRHNNESFVTLARATLGELQQAAAGDLESRRAAVDELVRPIRESLHQVDQQLKAVEKERQGAYHTLTEQVRSLGDTQRQLHGETLNLVKALRAPTTRGRWGELQLRRVVELSGMLPHCDFQEQATLVSEDGRTRPDLIVRLPGGRHVVVDAKAPLDAYLDAVEAPDDAQRDARLKDHARQVRDHVTKLGAKAYWSQLATAPDFVVMFLPGETFFNAAVQHDPSLFEHAAARRVVLASPTNLIALLYAVAHGWQQQRIADGALQIWELGQTLYDRLRVFAGHFESLRRALDGATDAYNAAVGSLETRVLPPARRFRELGTSTCGELPNLEPVGRRTRRLQTPDAAADLPTEAFAGAEPAVSAPKL
ncbi:MAG: DNA recombination protein RmuC [Deltaproteobacteria bacterium]|nr:DNA recombination protein RmuC [Deltaproteobacteria bacterium]